MTESVKTERYEAVLIYDSGLSEQDVQQQIERVTAVITAHSGSVEKQEVWGRRELAYAIQKKQYGIYVLLVFAGDNSLVSDLRRQLRINDNVLRSLIVKKDQFAPDALRPLGSSDGYRDRRPFSDDRFPGGDGDGDDLSL